MSHVSIISTKIIDQDEDNINEESSHVNDLCLVIMVHCLTNVEIRETCKDYESTIYRNLMDLTKRRFTHDQIQILKTQSHCYQFTFLHSNLTNNAFGKYKYIIT